MPESSVCCGTCDYWDGECRRTCESLLLDRLSFFIGNRGSTFGPARGGLLSASDWCGDYVSSSLDSDSSS